MAAFPIMGDNGGLQQRANGLEFIARKIGLDGWPIGE